MLKEDKNYYDHLIMGNNYWGHLLAFSLLKKLKKNKTSSKVLLLQIDEDKDKESRFHSKTILGPLEVKFLQKWGSLNGVTPFIHLNDYLEESPMTFHFDNKSLLLGKSHPFLNYLELRRKLPDFFAQKLVSLRMSSLQARDFNQAFDVYGDQLVDYLMMSKSSSIQQFFNYFLPHPNIFWDFAFDELKAFYQNFCDYYFSLNEKNIPYDPFVLFLRQMIFTTQGAFLNRFSDNISKEQLIYLLFCWLSPSYQLNNEKLMNDLKTLFIEEKGFFLRDSLKEMQLLPSNHFCLQLQKQESVSTQKLWYVDHLFHQLPFTIEKTNPTVNSFIVNYQLPPHFIPTARIGEEVLCSLSKNMGGNIAAWYLRFLTTETLEIECLFVKGEGAKASFYLQETEKYFQHSIKHFVPGLFEHFQESHQTLNMGQLQEGYPLGIFPLKRKWANNLQTSRQRSGRMKLIPSAYWSGERRNIHRVAQIQYWGTLRKSNLPFASWSMFQDFVRAFPI